MPSPLPLKVGSSTPYLDGFAPEASTRRPAPYICGMRRLREHQFVTIEVERPSASIECLVLAIDGSEAMLQPVDESQLMLVPTLGKDALLTFEFRSQLITLRGAGRRDDSANDLRFEVTDRVTVPQRRRYARVEVALPVTLTPLRADDATGAGEPIEAR